MFRPWTKAIRLFHNAGTSYQQVLLLNPDEPEALWGLLLCRYGVEYVDGPATGKRLPTVQPKPMQEQADFRRACDYAPEAVRAQYEREPTTRQASTTPCVPHG